MTSNNPEFDVSNLALDFPENSSVLVKSVWSNTSFSITLFDGLNTWTGEMDSDTITILSEHLGLSLRDYINECRSALSAKGKDKGFIYILKDDTFQWKKESLDMRITFGQICIQKTSVVSTLHNIINEMLNENLLLKEKLDRIEIEKNHLMADNKRLIETLEESNNLKCEMENDLYKQFLKVLNTKKEKIRELKKHTHLKSHDELKESDKMSKYECDTDIDSDSDSEEEGDGGSVSDKEERSKISDKESDSDEKSDKCLLLPKRNRLAPSQRTLPNRQAEDQKQTGLDSNKCKGAQETQSNLSKIKAVPSTSSCFPKKVDRRVAVSFVDSDEELGESSTVFFSDRKSIPSPGKNQENSSAVMHSPKKHGRFRNQLVEDETSIPCTENAPSAKIPKIENKCVSDNSESSIRSSENNHQKMNISPEMCVKNSESCCSENNQKQTKASVKDLINGLFS